MKKKNNKYYLLLLCFLEVPTSYCGNIGVINNIKYCYDNENYDDALHYIDDVVNDQDSDNDDRCYAFFYKALIDFRNNNYDGSIFALQQIVYNYSNWFQIDEAYYWLGKAQFAKGNYLEALNALYNIKINENIPMEDINNVIDYYFNYDIPNNVLTKCVCAYPSNETIVHKWLFQQSRAPFHEQYQWLIHDFLNMDQYSKYTKHFEQSILIQNKEQYHIVALLPLTTINEHINNKAYDIYKGLKLVFDEYQNFNKKFVFDAFDTNEDKDKVTSILEQLENVDIIIGPSDDTLGIVSEYCENHQILLYDLWSNNLISLGSNPFGFLLQPSTASQATAVAQFITDTFKDDMKIGIIYSQNTKDIEQADHFKNYLVAHNCPLTADISLNLIELKGILYKIRRWLTNGPLIPEDDDTYNTAIQICEKLKNVTHLYIASTNVMILTNTISILDLCNIHPIVICSYDYLDSDVTDEIFSRDNILYVSSYHIDYLSKQLQDFRNIYKEQYNVYPSMRTYISYKICHEMLANICQLRVPTSHDISTNYIIENDNNVLYMSSN